MAGVSWITSAGAVRFSRAPAVGSAVAAGMAAELPNGARLSCCIFALWWILPLARSRMLAVALVGVADSLLPAHRLNFCLPPSLRAARSRVLVAQLEARAGIAAPINVEAPGINGGDQWAGARGSDDELKATVDEAVSETVYQPVIPQFYPPRMWLWRQWGGTILQRVLPGEVFWSSVFTALLVLVFGRIRSTAAASAAWQHVAAAATVPALNSALRSVDKVWVLASGLVSFTLSFFLTQSYNFWREVYGKARAVQGRLNDIGMLCATSAARHADGPDKGQYTAEALQMLLTLGRCARGYSTCCSTYYGSTYHGSTNCALGTCGSSTYCSTPRSPRALLCCARRAAWASSCGAAR